MREKFFSLIDYDALNLWLNIIASGRTEWNLEECVETFGEEVTLHLPRLLSFSFLSGDYESFRLPTFPEFAQVLLEEVYVNMSRTMTSAGALRTHDLSQKFVLDLQKTIESYNQERVKNFGNLRASVEGTVSDMQKQVALRIARITTEISTGDEEVDQEQLLNAAEDVKERQKIIIDQLGKDLEDMYMSIIERSANLFAKALDINNFTVSSDKEISDITINTYKSAIDSKFESFRRRMMASTEMFRLEAGKLSKSQIELINSLDKIISSVLTSSLAELAENTQKIFDYIFINLRKNLDTLIQSLADRIAVSEGQTKEEVSNLVGSVFNINRNVIIELLEAIGILKESIDKMKAGLAKNLDDIENSIKSQVQSSIDQLESSVSDIKGIELKTIQKVNNSTNRMVDNFKNLIESHHEKVEEEVEKLKVSTKSLDNNTSLVSIVSATSEEVMADVLESLESYTSDIERIVTEKVTAVVERLSTTHVIIPKESLNKVGASYAVTESAVKDVKEVVDSQAITEDLKQSIDLKHKELRKIAESGKTSLLESARLQGENVKSEISKVTEGVRTAAENITHASETDVRESLEELKQSSDELIKEISKNMEAGFGFIYDQIDPINMRLMHFKEVETTEFFEVSKEKILNLADIIGKLISRIETHANSNNSKLEDQIKLTEMILHNQIEDLKVQVMGMIQAELGQNKQHLLESIENYMGEVKEKISSTEVSIGENVQKELDQPVHDLGLLLSKVDETIIGINETLQRDLKGIETEAHTLTTRLENHVETISQKIFTRQVAIADKSIAELESYKERFSENIKKLLQDMETKIEANMESLERDLEGAKSPQQDDLKREIRQLQKILSTQYEDLYINMIALLGELQRVTDVNPLNEALAAKAASLLEGVQLHIEHVYDLEDLKMLIVGLSKVTQREPIVP